MLLTLIPRHLLESPIPLFVLTIFTAFAAISIGLELEYFMVFYSTFSLGYSILFIFRSLFKPNFNLFNQTTLTAVGLFATGIFGIGYLQQIPTLMMIGPIIPVIYTLFYIFRHNIPSASAPNINKAAYSKQDDEITRIHVTPATNDALAITKPNISTDVAPQILTASEAGVSSWMDGKWFVHKLIATYQDTNSVGNVYFAQYGMWVGKTRELFFRYGFPEFDIKKTDWFILTRSYEHKFLREAREFDEIIIRIRVASFNRKFVT
ncbi:hypothetical protein TI05_17280, partial [Achromatium sp. WMS3]